MPEMRPRLRPDLRMHEYEESEGGKSIVIEDPVANKFFKLSTYEADLLRECDGYRTLEECVDRLGLHGRFITLEHAAKIIDKCATAGLIVGSGRSTSAFQKTLHDRIAEAKRQRSFFKLYFLYIPLLNPDGFLEKTLWLWRLAVNRVTGALMLLLAPGAVYFLITDMPGAKYELTFFFNLENLLYLWIAIVLVKLVHEFSHAYTAKSMGLRVPEMGVAFLVFFPCLYCNTTAAWQLADRGRRMAVSAAGVLSEAVVAVVAVYVWHFTQPGIVNSIAFFTAAVSLITSLLFNANPLMKFDGYFILIDWLRMPNLQAGAFQYLKRIVFTQVLGLPGPDAPSQAVRDRIIFFVYGCAAFVYRIFLYAGIIAAVYWRFDKTVGILLGALAAVLFILRPVLSAVRFAIERRSHMRPKPVGLIVTVVFVAGLIYILTVPLSDTSVYPCFVDSGVKRSIVVPAGAPVRSVEFRKGDVVKEGEAVLTLDPTGLEYDLKTKKTDAELTREEMAIIESAGEDLKELPIKSIELSQTLDAVKRIEQELPLLEWRAPFTGVITDLDPKLGPGYKPGKGTIVGELAAKNRSEVLGLVPQTDVHKLRPGMEVKVWFALGTGASYDAVVDTIDRFKREDLEGSPLSSRFGGEIAVTEVDERHRDAPLEAYYLCRMSFRDVHDVALGMTGKMAVEEAPRSILAGMVNAAYRTFRMETLF